MRTRLKIIIIMSFELLTKKLNSKSNKESKVMSDENPRGPKPDNCLIGILKKIIYLSLNILAIIMTLVIIWGIVDVLWVLYTKLMEEPKWILKISDVLATFGAFMAVLIAIEIFVNIVTYLKEDYTHVHIYHVEIVIGTALMAIARKVIILDFKEVSALYVFGTSTVILALGITYWLLYRSKLEKN